MRVLLCLFLVLAIGCDSSIAPDPTDGNSTTLEMAGKWMNNPDVGNLKIFRFEQDFAICWTDPDNGLRVCSATVPLGGGSEPDCGLQEGGDMVEVQIVDRRPDDPGCFLQRIVKGEVFITVRDTGREGTCFGSALVAEGTGQILNVDNDLCGISEGDSNANQWGWRSHGALTAVDGSFVDYSGFLHRVYGEPGSDGKSFFKGKNKVLLEY